MSPLANESRLLAGPDANDPFHRFENVLRLEVLRRSRAEYLVEGLVVKIVRATVRIERFGRVKAQRILEREDLSTSEYPPCQLLTGAFHEGRGALFHGYRLINQRVKRVVELFELRVVLL